MKKIIKIKGTSKNFWSKFIGENRNHKSITELIIDYSNCNFLEPYHVVLLACLIEEYHQKGIKINFNGGSDNNLPLQEYLSNIRFFEHWKDGFDRQSYTQNNRITNLCLWQLYSTMIDSYTDYAQKYFENHFSENKSFAPLHIVLAELFNNIIDHSASPVSGYTTSQFYPNSKKLKISVCDFGKGIPTAVNDYLKSKGESVLSDSNALSMAFRKGFSTKSTPRNRGYGLDTLATIVKESKGTLRVTTNKGLYTIKADGNIFKDDTHYFNGTHFEIILDTTTFYSKNEDNLEEEISF